MEKHLQALLLCGGKGERLRPLTDTVPKPMIPIKGRPILEYLIHHLMHHGVRDLVIAAGYRADVVKEYFRTHFRELKVTIVDSGDTDIIRRIQDCLPSLKEDFFVCYGDTLANVDLKALYAFHQQHRGKVTITGYPLKSQFGLMEFDQDGQVTHFAEKPTLDKWINIGYYCFDQKSAAALKNYEQFVDFLHEQVASRNFYGFKHLGHHITVNTIQELSDAEQNIAGFESSMPPINIL